MTCVSIAEDATGVLADVSDAKYTAADPLNGSKIGEGNSHKILKSQNTHQGQYIIDHYFNGKRLYPIDRECYKDGKKLEDHPTRFDQFGERGRFVEMRDLEELKQYLTIELKGHHDPNGFFISGGIVPEKVFKVNSNGKLIEFPESEQASRDDWENPQYDGPMVSLFKRKK